MRLMTPVKRPDILAPGKEAAETAVFGKTLLKDGDAGFDPYRGVACGGSGDI